MDTYNRIARNSIAVLIAKIVESGSGFFMAMILFRYLGPDYFGDYAFITALILALQPLINLELNTILIRDLARSPSRKGGLLGGAILLKGILLLCFIIVVGAISVSGWIRFSVWTRNALYLAAVGEVFQQIYWIVSPIFMAAERMVYETWISTIYRFWTLGGVLLLAILDSSASGSPNGFLLVFVVMATGHAVRMLMGILIVIRSLGWGKVTFQWSISRYLLKQMWLMGIATFCTAMSLRVDIFILKVLKGAKAVSMFHLPHIFILQTQVIAVALVTAVFPVFSRWSDPDFRENFVEIRDMYVRILGLFGFAVALMSTMCSSIIIRILSGQWYSEAEAVLDALAWCVPVLFLNFLGANLLITLKKQTYLIYGAVLSLVLNIGLDLAWVPSFGAPGAAWGTLLSYGCQLLVIYLFLRYSDAPRFPVLKLLWAVATVSVITLAAGWSLPRRSVSALTIRFFLGLAAWVLMYRLQPYHFRKKILKILMVRKTEGGNPLNDPKRLS